MPEIVVFPDAVYEVGSYLASRLTARGDATPVYSRVPNPRPATFVRVIRTGGPRRNLVVDDAQITVEAWAATDEAAHDLAQLCRAILLASPGDSDLIRDVGEVGGPGLQPDPDSNTPRYVFTHLVALRGSAA
jgi:hypothetical protein